MPLTTIRLAEYAISSSYGLDKERDRVRVELWRDVISSHRAWVIFTAGDSDPVTNWLSCIDWLSSVPLR